ncbi:hypothetical protein [Chelatococcus asaccharovorans]|uniref:hypothetical protein n=1 Tax=Chelatococcus asaccharovorans TaxID=28210 RepID=UPI00224C6D7D|nr:hypothetical protein [Chelatococcus asaccharovorans]CAH1668245.1 conserved exported hypothetical protein [Chelatococcus asaccharovorans]CAH1680286.1 conserved exported hypothetical protein [Chelatococcus asaccharovorans]
MLNSFGRLLAAAGLLVGAGLAAVPASAAPAGMPLAAPSSALNVEPAQYYPPPPGYRHPPGYRPGYRPPPPGYRYGYRPVPRRVCRWETVRVRGPYGGWATKRVQRCYRRY